MIEFNCSRCQSAISAQDQQAGQSVICPNCSATVTVPGPAAQGPAAAAPIAAPVAGQQPQIVVNIQQPAASPNMVHKKVNGLVVYLLFVFLNGSQYMYMGQIGKGVLMLILDWCLGIFMIVTCGIGALIYIPYRLLCLIDTIVVFSRMKKGPIHPWRYF